MIRFWASLNGGLLALFVARALHVPFWNDGWTLDAIGDQCDFFMAAFALVWCLPRPSHPSPPNE